jgi:AcrR family transcriptional regulator
VTAVVQEKRGVAGSAARERIVLTADRLFYGTGIRSVGVERVITEAGVARMTFFRHFPTKDDLVVTFLSRRAEQEREALERVRAENPGRPRVVLDHFAAGVADQSSVAEFRGCEFINTAAEYCDPSHPVRHVVAEHRAWVVGSLRDALVELGHPAPQATAELLLMLRTGAMVAGALEGLSIGDDTFEKAWWSLVGD